MELLAHAGRAAALVIAAAVLFGTTGTAQALGAHGAPAPAVGGLRIAVGGLLLAGLALLRGRTRPIAALVRGHSRAVLMGAAAVASYQLCFFGGGGAPRGAAGGPVGLG